MPKMPGRNVLRLPPRALACLLTTLLLTALLPARAAAWGVEGHRLVAALAEKHLSGAARQQVGEILAGSGMCPGADVSTKMKCVANWADDARKTTHKNTYNWHFVDIPLARGYKPAVDCEPPNKAQKGRCGIFGLDYARRILRREVTDPKISRAQALMFVIHIVGDLHQPLHTVLEKTGGNFYFVKYEGDDTNLHEVWDTDIIQSEMHTPDGPHTESAYILMLEKVIEQGGLASFQQGDPVGWLAEAHGLAAGDAYAGLPKVNLPDHPFLLGSNYFGHNVLVVNTQLERAGARLAKILNEDLH